MLSPRRRSSSWICWAVRNSCSSPSTSCTAARWRVRRCGAAAGWVVIRCSYGLSVDLATGSVLVVVVAVHGVPMTLVHVVGVVAVPDRGVLAIGTVLVRVRFGHLRVQD